MGRNFDGIDDHIAIADTPFDYERTQAFSIYAMIFPTLVQTGAIVAKQVNSVNFEGFNLIAVDSGGLKLAARISNSLGGTPNAVGKDTTAGLATSVWKHVAMTYDGGSLASGLKLYIDGVDQATTTTNDNLTGSILNNVNLRIGSRDGNGIPFGGNILNAGINKRVLSAAEIKQAMLYGWVPGSLDGFWPIWGVASPEPDLSGRGNNGTVVGTGLASHGFAGRYVPAPRYVYRPHPEIPDALRVMPSIPYGVP